MGAQTVCPFADAPLARSLVVLHFHPGLPRWGNESSVSL
jgi:hypothetical protein